MADDQLLGHWPLLDQLLQEAEQLPRFLEDTRAQAHLIHALGRPEGGYWVVHPQHQQEMLSRCMRLIPRLQVSPTPKLVLEALFNLHLSHKPLENISRALKVVDYTPRTLYSDEDIFPTTGWLGAFTNWNRESDVPLAYYFWAGVATIGAACRYNWFIDRGNDMLRLNHYMVLVGTKATGKSTALGAALEVLSHLNMQVWGWKPGSPLPPDDKHNAYQVRILPEDTNQETLVRILKPRLELADSGARIQVDSTGLLALDELATFLGRDTWAIQKRVPFLTRIHSGETYEYHTQRGGEIILKNLAVSLLACCTPDWLRDAISPLLFGGGFLDRTLLIYRDPLPPPPLFPTPRPRDPLTAAALAALLVPLTARQRREEMMATPRAHKWYDQWYVEQEDSEDPRETSVKRRALHLWKLAAVLSLSEGTQPLIHTRHFELAAAIFAAEWRQYRKLLVELHTPPEAELMRFIEFTLLKVGAVEGKSHMNKSALFSQCRNRQGLSPPNTKAVPFLESLEAEGRVKKIITQAAKGRTAEAWYLTKETAEELKRVRRGRPNAPPVLREPHQPEDQHQVGTASQEPEDETPAPTPAPAPEQGSHPHSPSPPLSAHRDRR